MADVSSSTKSAYKGVFLLFLFFIVLYFTFPEADARFLDKSALSSYVLDQDKQYQFAIVADLDRMSKDVGSKKPNWRSVLKFGSVFYDSRENQWSVYIDEAHTHDIYSHLGEAGRGMELSELLLVDHQLLAFDDRSGIVFELSNGEYPIQSDLTKAFQCIPRYIVTEGDGFSPKGQKTEWATMKDGEMYVGSFGKEFTLTDGSVAHRKNLWVSIIDKNGKIRHSDWTNVYNLLRKATNTEFPGYMIHEAVMFNEYRREWVILPRRVSTEPYDEKLDELKGSNLIIRASEYFEFIDVVEVGDIVPERGFSSFKFVPGTKGKVILALKTVEKEDKETGESEQTSFITMFDLSGNILIPDTEIAGEAKFEGIEFLE